ncbi:MAG: hypothetical protein ACFFED_17285 [Candidatus Thorarchaeota archaeon]
MKVREALSEYPLEFAIYSLISLVICVFTGIVYFSNPTVFIRFIGDVNPLLLIPVLAMAGFGIILFFFDRGWFRIFKRENLRGCLPTFIVAIILAFAMITVDLVSPFPEDTNVQFPLSLIFYPIMGYIVEILFHLAPLALILAIASSLFKQVEQRKILWVGLIAVALLEPIYQMSWGIAATQPIWQIAYTGIHVFMINFMELHNFKRYDFVSMYSFRLVYYLFWHIIWGLLRLSILF